MGNYKLNISEFIAIEISNSITNWKNNFSANESESRKLCNQMYSDITIVVKNDSDYIIEDFIYKFEIKDKNFDLNKFRKYLIINGISNDVIDSSKNNSKKFLGVCIS